MSYYEGHHHHHEDPCYEEGRYGYGGAPQMTRYGYGAPPPPQEIGCERRYYENSTYIEPPPQHLNHSIHNYKRNEHLGEIGAVAAGAFALYEGHKAKTDVEHSKKHSTEAAIASAAAVGSAGYAFYEHHEKKKYEHGYGY